MEGQMSEDKASGPPLKTAFHLRKKHTKKIFRSRKKVYQYPVGMRRPQESGLWCGGGACTSRVHG